MTCLYFFLGTNRQLQTFFNFSHKIHKNFTFTVEKEADNSINFSYLSITKIENKLSLTVMVIHNNSLHPCTHKLAFFDYYIHGLLSVPMSVTDFDEEVKIIEQIAVNNGSQAKLRLGRRKV